MNRKIICCLLALVFVVLSFSGCHQPTLEADEIIAKTNNHIVYRVENLYYMEFFEKVTGSYTDISCRDKRITFESLDDMRKTILENKFNFQQQRDLENTSDGVVEIVDVEHLWQPVYPNDVSLNKLMWFSGKYNFELKSSKYATDIDIAVYANSIKLSTTEEKAECDRTDGILKTILPSNDSRQYVDYFVKEDGTTDVFVHVYYTTVDDGNLIEVYEYYVYYSVGSDFEIPKEGIPGTMRIIINSDELVCSMVMTSFTSRPTEEWLLSFGMEPFVPEE